MSKKTLLKAINNRLEELDDQLEEGYNGNVIAEIQMEMETLQYVTKMVDKHIE